MFKDNAFSTFRVFPAEGLFLADYFTSAALEAVFIIYTKFLPLFRPLINLRRANKGAAFTDALAAILLTGVKM